MALLVILVLHTNLPFTPVVGVGNLKQRALMYGHATGKYQYIGILL
jgi:hypothetical protein